MTQSVTRRIAWEHYFGVLALILLAIGTTQGLFFAPAEKHMGDVQRIMYVHVPTAWAALIAFTAAFIAAIGSLWTHRQRWDAAMTGLIEAGAVLTGMLLVQGMIWGRATWGVWWDWDVRLTTSLIMLLLFVGVLILRSFVEDPARRASWSAVVAIMAYVDVPLVYFCVRWWRSLHQIQSSPETVDSAMVMPLRINAFGFLFLAIWFAARRARIELARRREEESMEPPPRQESVSKTLSQNSEAHNAT